jgi:hypothetical protein
VSGKLEVANYALLLKSDNPSFGMVCGIFTVIAAVLLQIEGYSRLMDSGERFNIGATSADFGVTLNLNTVKHYEVKP